MTSGNFNVNEPSPGELHPVVIITSGNVTVNNFPPVGAWTSLILISGNFTLVVPLTNCNSDRF